MNRSRLWAIVGGDAVRTGLMEWWSNGVMRRFRVVATLLFDARRWILARSVASPCAGCESKGGSRKQADDVRDFHGCRLEDFAGRI